MDWDLTPDGPVKATSYTTVEDTINILRMLYGEKDENNDDLYLPSLWGTNHPDIIDQWFHRDKLNEHHKADLGITDNINGRALGQQPDNNIPSEEEDNGADDNGAEDREEARGRRIRGRRT